MTPRAGLPLIGFALVAAPIVGLSLYVWPAADDFHKTLELARTGSIPAYLQMMYANWSGRLAAELAIVAALANPDLHRLVALIPPLAFALTPLAFVGTLRNLGARISLSTSLLLGSLGVVAAWFGLGGYLPECVFWVTGGIGYALPLMLGIVWLAALLSNRSHPAVLIACGFALGFAHEQLCGALLLIVLAVAIWHPQRRRVGVASFLALAVATVLMVSAPGNAVRAQVGAGGFSLSPVDLLQSYAALLPALADRVIVPVVVGAATGLLYAMLTERDCILEPRVMQWAAVMALGAVGATAPLGAVPGYAIDDGRTAFFPAAFLLAAACGASFVCMRRLLPEWRRVHVFGVALATSSMIAFFSVALNQIGLARALEPELTQRWRILSHADGSADIRLSPLVSPGAAVIHSPEFAVDPNYWVNARAAKYFGVRSIALADR